MTTSFGFLLAVLAHGHRDRVAVAEVGPQLLVEQLLVVRDHGVRRLEDAHRRAVVLFELDQLEVRVVARQAAQVLDVGAAPAVDRLVVVADRGERRARAGELLEQAVLAGVGVLVLVDEQVAQAVLPFVEHFRVLVEQLDRQRDEVVEIDRLIRLERRRVAGVGERGEFSVSFSTFFRATSGETSAFFQFEISVCRRRIVALSALPERSEMMP
jgi:hypothetical protein